MGGVLLLAQRQQSCCVVWSELHSGLQPLDTLLRGRSGGAADVVLERGQRFSARRGEEGLLGHVEHGVHLAGDLPGDGVLGVEEAVELGSVLERAGERERVDGEHLRLDGDVVVAGSCPLLHGVAADDDVVGVKLLRDADGRRA